MIRVAQLLLVISALTLWVASRLSWVSVGSFDGLGPTKTVNLNGAAWSTALLPFAVLLVAAALAGLAVRGWLLRAMAILLALVSFALGYLGVTLLVMPDVGPRGAELAGVDVATLVYSERHLTGAVLTLVAAGGVLLAAVLLMRSAVSGDHRSAKYAGPGSTPAGIGGDSERGMWDALDEGRDPTDSRSEKEGR